MLLYVINAGGCLHRETWRMFFFEPVARKRLEIFEADWTPESLTAAFRTVGGRINRRNQDPSNCQVLVCVRRQEAERFKETTLYAKAMVSLCLERSGMVSVITGAYTKKVTVLFQVEQAFFGDAPRTDKWEEEQEGYDCLRTVLEIGGRDAVVPDFNVSLKERSDKNTKAGGLLFPEEALEEALRRKGSLKDPVASYIRSRMAASLEDERASQDAQEEELLSLEQKHLLHGNADETVVDVDMNGDGDTDVSLTFAEAPDEDFSGSGEETLDYLGHRLRSLAEGGGLNAVAEVVYWPVQAGSSRAQRNAALGLVELICAGKEINAEDKSKRYPWNHPEDAEDRYERFCECIVGYREQLERKRELLLSEDAGRQNAVNREGDTDAGEGDDDYFGRSAPYLSMPVISEGLLTKLNEADRQTDDGFTKIRSGSSRHLKERIDEICESLASAYNGLEAELSACEQEMADYVCREAGPDQKIAFTFRQDKEDKKSGLPEKRPLSGEAADEEEAMERIRTWKEGTRKLAKSARLTDSLISLFSFAAALAAAAVPYAAFQYGVWESRPAAMSGIAALCVTAAVLLAGRLSMPKHFIRKISESYGVLANSLKAVNRHYERRTEAFAESMRQLLAQVEELQEEQDLLRMKEEEDRNSSMYSWHLMNLKRLADSTEGFGWDLPLSVELDPESLRRIEQPMDFMQKEIGNEIYWPVLKK